MKLTAITLSLAFAAQVTAQVPLWPLPDRGMMSGLPTGIVFDTTRNEISLRPPGLTPALTTFANTGGSSTNGPGNAEYTTTEIIRVLNQDVLSPGTTLPFLELDAMSTGNDLLPIFFDPDANGGDGEFRVNVGSANGWATLYLSTDAAGSTANYTGSEVFGYYFENPSFPQQLRTATYHELLGSDYASGAAPGRVAALDLAMGLIEANDGQIEEGLIIETSKLYFSLTQVGAALVQAICSNLDWQNPQTGVVEPYPRLLTGGTIFVAEFDVVTGDCTSVGVHIGPEELLMTAYADIDALAIGRVVYNHPTGNLLPLIDGTLQYLVSTTTPDVGDEDLMMVALVQDPPPTSNQPASDPKRKRRLRTKDGNTLIGGSSVTGNVKGACSQDPEFLGGANSFGVPTAQHPLQGATNDLSWSLAARTEPGPAGQDTYTINGSMSGWGTGQPGYSLCVLWVEIQGLQLPIPLADPRLATDMRYEFSATLSLPWLAQVPQPHNPFTLWIHQDTIVGSTVATHHSWPLLLTRVDPL